MKITEIKTHRFKTTTMKHGVHKYRYWRYPIEMLQRGPRETVTTIVELLTETGTIGYGTGTEKRKRSASFLPMTTDGYKSPPDGPG